MKNLKDFRYMSFKLYVNAIFKHIIEESCIQEDTLTLKYEFLFNRFNISDHFTKCSKRGYT